MRLTIINQFYRPDVSPTAQLSASFAEHRAAIGDDVTVITSRGGYVAQPVAGAGAAEGESLGRLRVRRMWTPRLGKATIVKRLIDYGTFYSLAAWTLLTMRRQDVVVSLTTPPYVALLALLHKFTSRKSKIVLWNMDCYPDVVERAGIIRKGGMISRVLRFFNRFIFRHIDHFVALDTAMVDLMVSQYAPRDERRRPPVTIIPNWEDASFFPANATPPRWDEASSLGLDGAFVVLYLGNTGVGHTFDAVLDAAHLLRDTNVKFLFVGGGARWKQLQNAKAERGLRNVLLHEYVAKELTPSVMAAADMALITLRDEALGVMSPSKLHANLASGLPVVYVGPAGSNVDDAIARYNCGISLRSADTDRLAATLRSLAADPARLESLQKQARVAFDTAYCDLRTLPLFDTVIDTLGPKQSTTG